MALQKLVFGFRHAIEIAKANGEDGYFFRKFPTGQCGAASDMLAQYLIDHGYSHITYVNGTLYSNAPSESRCHTWLEVKGLVVDITGDQFKYDEKPLQYDIPVYIGPMTAYYQQFEVLPGGTYEHFGLDKSCSNYYDLKKWYKTIMYYLSTVF
ncbi:hypothetical protein [Pseudoflavonifractor phocaeensis]|uniref:hypothetical protein n=1 Tax=Pseudoflavonifractor phocaeensis TaxID=1870988 RepID=UPI00210C689C|nr:hypothetical protein [Pseudoflavonifractor phocaeensis]MCQ4863487.1 hypothetical protein [Pseudoflavonifractor phocaeensis]